jgi:hypothetical protein
MKTPRPDGLTDELLQRVVDGLPTLVSDQVGLISWHGIITLHLPRPLELAWLGVIGTLVIGALIAGSARTRLVLLAVVAGWAVMPLAALVSQPEVSWQGRYGLPIGGGDPGTRGLDGRPAPAASPLGRPGHRRLLAAERRLPAREPSSPDEPQPARPAQPRVRPARQLVVERAVHPPMRCSQPR